MLKIWVHLVWSTKWRKPLLLKCIRNNIFRHIRENARKQNIHIDFINGHFDHVHILVSLNAEQTIAKTVKLIKGESARWINLNRLTKETFEWQGRYYAVSVSESDINRVRNYIKNQEQHHVQKTFLEECGELNRRFGFTANDDAFE